MQEDSTVDMMVQKENISDFNIHPRLFSLFVFIKWPIHSNYNSIFSLNY